MKGSQNTRRCTKYEFSKKNVDILTASKGDKKQIFPDPLHTDQSLDWSREKLI